MIGLKHPFDLESALDIHTRVRAFGLTFQRLKVYNSAQNTVSVPCYPTYSYALTRYIEEENFFEF